MSREATLARTMVELADNLVEDFDVVELLTLLADRCVEVLDVDAAGIMLATPDGELQLVTSSSEAMRMVELFELQAREGPCQDCFCTGRPAVNADLTAADVPWPAFAAVALDAGFRAADAIPMRLRQQVVGALNLFRSTARPLHDDDVAAAQAFADIATIAIVQHRVATDARLINEQLSTALQSRVIIEQSKGMVAERLQLSMDGAFHLLRNHARNHQLPISELARRIVDGAIDPVALDAPSRT